MQQPFDFLSASNSAYIDQQYEVYKKDPRAVSDLWRAFFAGFEAGSDRSDGTGPALPTGSPLVMGVFDLVHSYRELGHFCSKLDPLGLVQRADQPLLTLDNFGMTEMDLDRQVGVGGFSGATDGTLRDLIAKLKLTYTGPLGVEFIHVNDKRQRDWLTARMEPIYNQPELTADETRELMFQLIAAEEFEGFLGRSFVGAKRFGLEGGEALVPMLNMIVDEGAILGGEQFIFNMAHRGRLNVLAHTLNKPYETILSEFAGTSKLIKEVGGDGDVKYHLGYANTRKFEAHGQRYTSKISLVPNPSHLELISPIMQGITRCKQVIFGDTGRNKVVPIAIHGDAAFVGQGIVAETLALSELPGWRTGGTIHVIVNNQIGFTTPPSQGRFTPYPTDMAKAVQAPIFHVNGDDPEACAWAAKLAIGFRQEFKVDVIIDLWCYRRNGHNETDPADFTQPVMYRAIEKHLTTRQLYSQKLLAENRLNQQDVDDMKKLVVDRLTLARDASKEIKPRTKVPNFSGVWSGYGRAGSDWTAATAVPRERLEKVMDVLRQLPANFTVNPKVQKSVVDKRLEMVATGKGIDWGCAEMLAFGSLMQEDFGVRLTGQDVERGTFAHRHAVLNDFNTGDQFWPLSRLSHRSYQYVVMNSMLSEFAVMAYEWGYSSADPRNLVLWEAQFGDFVNGAQPIIDQIMVSAESKWRFASGLTLLLPHGYEGAGPEHSNAYLERFLSLCAEDNIQVAVCSTPAQYFHILRRQMIRKFRKPLVLMQPKSLLRDTNRASSIEEITSGSFQNVIDDPAVKDPQQVRRVLVCCGKVYYTLRDARNAQEQTDIAVVRVEQLYPFPQDELQKTLDRYARKSEVVWVQEEPKNKGAWSYMEPRLRAMLPDALIAYAGRDEAASPAVGSLKEHNVEEAAYVAFSLAPATNGNGHAPVSATSASQVVAK